MQVTKVGIDTVRVTGGNPEKQHEQDGLDEHDESIDCAEESTWCIESETEIVPGVLAWDLLGMGRRFEMWVGWSLDRLTPVCIKIPRKDQLTATTINALAREYEAARSFSHPAIPRLFEWDLVAARPYLLYEFVEGKPLSRVIREDGPLGAADLVLLGLQLAAALRHVHRRGFVHLDVKPSNVALRGDRAMLLDFDIALRIGDRRSQTKPRGTRFYIPPEQIRCQPAQPSMDVFALGALLYEACSGVVAFDVPSDSSSGSQTGRRDRVYRQLGEPIKPIGVLRPDLPVEVASVVDRLMAVDVEQRPASADEVIRLLEASVAGLDDVEGMWPTWVSDVALASDPPTLWPDPNPDPEPEPDLD